MLTAIVRKLFGAVAFVFLSITAVNACATTLNFTATADDIFQLFISTNDSLLGERVTPTDTTDNWVGDWKTSFSTSALLTSGVTNFIHVIAEDKAKGGAGFIGDFSLNNNEFSFANGTQKLSTDITNWGVSSSGFGGPYSTPVSKGLNGVKPWYLTATSSISLNASWIWNDSICCLHPVYFSTAITPVVVPPKPIAAVPEPETYTMLLAGLGLLIFSARRRKEPST